MGKLGEHVHWFLTSECNDSCDYCFKPEFAGRCDDSRGNLSRLANILVDGGVKKVTIGGGEPMLVDYVYGVLGILKDGGIRISLHTNGLLLNEKRIGRLSSLVGDIALPIDSMDSGVRSMLGRRGDINDTLETAKRIVGRGIPLGVHTVATDINVSGIPKVYEFLEGNDFDYWRIYEFNDVMVDVSPSDVERYSKMVRLEGDASAEAGHTDCLFARFLLMEEEMAKYGDDRVRFIGKRDNRNPYVFLDNFGNVRYCAHFSMNRTVVGNVFNGGFGEAKKGLEAAFVEGVLFDEPGFIEEEAGFPLWVRAYLGNYFSEELEAVSSKYAELFCHLQDLYVQRSDKLEEALVV